MKRIIIEVSNEELLTNCQEIIVRIKDDSNAQKKQSYHFSNFIQQLIEDWEQKHHYRTADTYRSTMNSFMTYRNKQDILLSDINNRTIEGYERFLLSKGVVKNSTSFYMRILRAVYNRAVDDGLIEDLHPFRHVYTGIDTTDKRAIRIDAIRAIKDYEAKRASMRFAKDMFMFSFYTRGMSFVDMAYLQRSNLADGYLTYRRQKTGTLLKIKWEQQMQDIIDRNPASSDTYLLPILSQGRDIQAKKIIHACQRKINRNLQNIAEKAGLNIHLTMYVARHSWASIARQMQIPISIISDGMGHHSEKTTRIYLKTMDTAPVDNANHRIIEALDASKEATP